MRGSNEGSGANPGGDETVDAADPKVSGSPVGPARAADVEELLRAISQVRLSVSAELSAAAGALDAQRPDVAGDIVSDATADIARLRALVASEVPDDAPVLVRSGGGDAPAPSPGLEAGLSDHAPGSPRKLFSFIGWQTRVLVGALALAIALLALPSAGGGPPRSATPSAGGAQPVDTANLRLVSTEFTSLREALQSKSTAPTEVLAVGSTWHASVERTLPEASTQEDTARHIVMLLRQERALLEAPSAGTPAQRDAADLLRLSADQLLDSLRKMADQRVRSVLPSVITALPVNPAPTTSPSPSTSTGPVTTPTPTPTTSAPPSSPVPSTSAPTTPASPAPTTPVPSSPAPSPSLPVLPSVIQNLGGLLPTPSVTVPATPRSNPQTPHSALDRTPETTPTAPAG